MVGKRRICEHQSKREIPDQTDLSKKQPRKKMLMKISLVFRIFPLLNLAGWSCSKRGLTSSSHTKLHNILYEQNSIPMDSCTVRAHFNISSIKQPPELRRNLEIINNSGKCCESPDIAKEKRLFHQQQSESLRI